MAAGYVVFYVIVVVVAWYDVACTCSLENMAKRGTSTYDYPDTTIVATQLSYDVQNIMSVALCDTGPTRSTYRTVRTKNYWYIIITLLLV